MNCCKLYIKLYKLIFILRRVFSQSDGQVLLQVGYFITSSPEPLPNWKYKVEVNNKKPNWNSSARTKVQQLVKISTSSPTCSNTFVCVQRSCLCDESRSLDGRSRATFTIKPVVCCVALRSKVMNDATGASVSAERTVKRLWGPDNCYLCKKKRCTWLFQRS